MKAVVAAFNQEKALLGAFSVIVQLHRLIDLRHYLIPHSIYFLVMLEGWENQHSPATGPGEATVSVGSSQYISVTWQNPNQNI